MSALIISIIISIFPCNFWGEGCNLEADCQLFKQGLEAYGYQSVYDVEELTQYEAELISFNCEIN